jgi:hypothetical protein
MQAVQAVAFAARRELRQAPLLPCRRCCFRPARAPPRLRRPRAACESRMIHHSPTCAFADCRTAGPDVRSARSTLEVGVSARMGGYKRIRRRKQALNASRERPSVRRTPRTRLERTCLPPARARRRRGWKNETSTRVSITDPANAWGEAERGTCAAPRLCRRSAVSRSPRPVPALPLQASCARCASAGGARHLKAPGPARGPEPELTRSRAPRGVHAGRQGTAAMPAARRRPWVAFLRRSRPGGIWARVSACAGAEAIERAHPSTTAHTLASSRTEAGSGAARYRVAAPALTPVSESGARSARSRGRRRAAARRGWTPRPSDQALDAVGPCLLGWMAGRRSASGVSGSQATQNKGVLV